jgi:benzoylsuccinyl-CoA thiolase BbsA subunit
MAKDKEKEKEPDVTFYHPDLFHAPEGNPSEAYLKGYRCKKCGQLDFPKLNPCPTCWGEEFEMVPLSRRGKLYSYADIYIGQPGLKTPYVIGYIDLPEDLRIFAMLEGEVTTFKCEEEVELTIGEFRKNRDGLPIMSYKFKKVNA